MSDRLQIRREILILWGSDDVRRQRPSPMDEVRSGLYIFEQTVWDATHPKPESGDAFERKLCKWWNDDAQLQLLVMAGKVIAANMRRMDVAARYGGDEFVLLLPHASAEGPQACAVVTQPTGGRTGRGVASRAASRVRAPGG